MRQGHAFVRPEFDQCKFVQLGPTPQYHRIEKGISKIGRLLAVHLQVHNILV